MVLLLSVFAAGGGNRQGSVSPPGSPAPAVTPVVAAAGDSCASFDSATGRLAANDNKGFIDDMTVAATDAQTAASTDAQWQSLVGDFALFATDLAANDATKVYNDLTAINEQCAAARGPRTLNLKPQP
ncbi:MAG TPA: hypothetical protein VKQ71_16185 [Acidimicrobiales bacterium]|nr:hypothetical protein [Acidimicrobiales bacterium]